MTLIEILLCLSAGACIGFVFAAILRVGKDDE